MRGHRPALLRGRERLGPRVLSDHVGRLLGDHHHGCLGVGRDNGGHDGGVDDADAVEAAHPVSWYRWVGDHGTVVGIETFGASAPYQTLYEKYGITADRVAAAATALVR